jgi:hypothetical protein
MYVWLETFSDDEDNLQEISKGRTLAIYILNICRSTVVFLFDLDMDCFI